MMIFRFKGHSKMGYRRQNYQSFVGERSAVVVRSVEALTAVARRFVVDLAGVVEKAQNYCFHLLYRLAFAFHVRRSLLSICLPRFDLATCVFLSFLRCKPANLCVDILLRFQPNDWKILLDAIRYFLFSHLLFCLTTCRLWRYWYSLPRHR